MKSDDPTIKRNPARYRELSVPFTTTDEANESLQKFFNAVEAARVEFKIPDAYVVAQVSIVYPAGEGSGFATANFGNSLAAESLAAYAYGRERRKREEAMAKMLRGETDE